LLDCDVFGVLFLALLLILYLLFADYRFACDVFLRMVLLFNLYLWFDCFEDCVHILVS